MGRRATMVFFWGALYGGRDWVFLSGEVEVVVVDEVTGNGRGKEFGVLGNATLTDELLVMGVVLQPSAKGVRVHACCISKLGFGIVFHCWFSLLV